jgi:hypothetical protein
MIRFLVAAGWMLSVGAVAAQTFVVPPELWDRPRSGRAILESPAVRQAVGAWLAQPGARFVLHHGAGQDSLLAAEELRSWLAALAIEPARIALRNDLAAGEPLRIDILRD